MQTKTSLLILQLGLCNVAMDGVQMVTLTFISRFHHAGAMHYALLDVSFERGYGISSFWKQVHLILAHPLFARTWLCKLTAMIHVELLSLESHTSSSHLIKLVVFALCLLSSRYISSAAVETPKFTPDLGRNINTASRTFLAFTDPGSDHSRHCST